MLLQNLPQSLLLLVLTTANQGAAFPFPRDALRNFLGVDILLPRDCRNPCGYSNQYCCAAQQTCYTSGIIAGCANTAAGGGWGFYTTTWTQTQTFTSTYSSLWPAATTIAPALCVPQPGTGQKACGSICCASWQYCARDGQCMADGPDPGTGGGGVVPAPAPGPPVWTTYTTTGGAVITTQFNPPYRPTTTGSGAQPTGTDNTTAPAGAGGSTSPALSPGAIAGIVIGVLAGIVLLVLLCACCVVRGLWHGALAILGLGKKKERRSETIIHEEEYHSGTAHGRRQKHGGWFGMGGGRPHSVSPSRKSEKKKSSGAGLMGLGALAGTLMLLLGLRRDKKRKDASRRSEPGSSYWSGSYTTDSRDSRGTRHTRDTRRSHRTQRTHQSRTASRRP